MADRRPPTARQRRLGAELRRLREQAGVSSERAAEEIDAHFSKISRMELGQVGVRRIDLRALLDLYGVADAAQRQALENLSKEARQSGWWQSYTDVLPPAYADFIGMESSARRIGNFEAILIPGLLQTADYARAVITEAWEVDGPEQVDQLVEVRVARQGLLTREQPVELNVVVCEAAIRQLIGGPETMRAQLEALAQAARLPHVTIQVLEAQKGAHPGLNGPFAILGFGPDDPDVVLVENLVSSLYFERAPEIDRYRWVFDRLRTIAASPRDSVAMIERAAEDLT